MITRSLSAMYWHLVDIISLVVASLVVAIVMELNHQRATNRFVLAAALILVSTLIGLMAPDTITRDTPPLAPGRVGGP